MPGVPTGRACEGCRKQKKKCDEVQPTCSRCRRLGIECVGPGLLRYKFKDGHRAEVSPNKSDNVNRPSARPKSCGTALIGPPSTSPGNQLTLSTNAFIASIRRSTDFRYNLWWAFGMFLEDIPQRLGFNEALDRSVEAMTSAHTNFCTGRNASEKVLVEYNNALQTLRVYLDDPTTAHSPNTLCAVMMLLICQAFLGPNGQRWSGHAEGAARILKARRDFGPRDGFERKLFMSLRGSVLFEGLFNDNIHMEPHEWESLVKNDFESGTPEGQMMQLLSQAPGIIRRGREASGAVDEWTNLQIVVQLLYDKCKANLSILRQQSTANKIWQTDPNQQSLFLRIMCAHYQRTYAIGLVVTIVFGRILATLRFNDEDLLQELMSLAQEMYAVALESNIYRPIGAGYLIVCLPIAWAGTTDLETRLLLETIFNDYLHDFSFARSRDEVRNGLEGMARTLRLEGSEPTL